MSGILPRHGFDMMLERIETESMRTAKWMHFCLFLAKGLLSERMPKTVLLAVDGHIS